MKSALVLLSLLNVALAAPEGYQKSSPSVVEHGNLNGFQPSFNFLPCNHNGDVLGAATQTQGRILNHPNKIINSLEGASSQDVTVNSHIVVGDNQPAATANSGGGGGGYNYNPSTNLNSQFIQQLPPPPPPPQPSIHYNPAPQLPPQIPAQPFNPAHFLPPPPRPIPIQQHGYNFNQVNSGQGNSHVHHHYTVKHPTAIINGPGKAPPPLQPLPPLQPPPPQSLGFQYSPSFSYNKNIGISSSNSAQFSRPVYHPPPNRVPSFIEPSSSYASSFGNYAHDNNLQFQNSFGSSSNSFAPSSHISSSSNIGLNNQLGQVIQETFSGASLDPTVEKHIYVHVPPEDLEESNKLTTTHHLPQSAPKKHYKIIFIKAPTTPSVNYAQMAAVAAQQTEEKTLVYVLVKKPDEPSLQEIQQIQQNTLKTNKPEVYFIKYKTHYGNQASGPVYTPSTGSGNFDSGAYHAGNSNNLGQTGSDVVSNLVGSTSSTSSSSTSTIGSSSGGGSGKHELYGVPLE